MKWAILGGGNCYALNLARHLLKQGHEVLGIGRSALKSEAFTLGVEGLGYDYRVYSVGPDTEFIVEILNSYRPQVVVNFSAQGEGQASFKVEHWKYFYRTNTQYLVELTEKLHGVPWMERFIQVGTSELYGSVDKPVNEEAPIRPTSPYAASKAAFDLHLMSVAKVCGFPALVVRPSNCVCEGQQLHRVIPKALIYGMTGKRLPLHGGGKARKSYLHADDLSAAIVLLAEKGRVSEVYNAGPDQPTSIKAVLDLCADSLEMKPDRLYQEATERPGQDGCYWLDSSKLKSLGWKQSLHLEGAVYRMSGWLKEYPELLRMDTDYRIRG